MYKSLLPETLFFVISFSSTTSPPYTRKLCVKVYFIYNQSIMKPHTINNRIKYVAGTLALSGMLVIGGCDSNSNNSGTDDEYPTRTESGDHGLGQPSRDNVSRENVNTRVHDDNGEDREVESNKEDRDANEVINERQRTQQRGNLERANEDTLNGQYQPLDNRDKQVDNSERDQ